MGLSILSTISNALKRFSGALVEKSTWNSSKKPLTLTDLRLFQTLQWSKIVLSIWKVGRYQGTGKCKSN